jgi:lipopolysaccharide export LptBFGC system permease protein LptF
VIWLGTGLSVNRIVAPALLFSLLVGVCAQFIQNNVSPATNKRQNDLRRYIRSGERTLAAQNGEIWVSVAEEKRIYLIAFRREVPGTYLEQVSYYEFDETGTHLRRVVRSESISGLSNGAVSLAGRAYDLGPRAVRSAALTEVFSAQSHIQSLNTADGLPNELSTKELSDNLQSLKSAEVETAPVSVELEGRRTTPFIPLVLTLTAAPFIFLQSRQKLTSGLYYAVASMLIFLILSQVSRNLGAGGHLPPKIAVWSVPVLFASFGLYLMTRVRT